MSHHAASHTLSGSTLAPRSRSGSFSFLRLSLTETLIVMSVSCGIAFALLCIGAAMLLVLWCRCKREVGCQGELQQGSGGWSGDVRLGLSGGQLGCLASVNERSTVMEYS